MTVELAALWSARVYASAPGVRGVCGRLCYQAPAGDLGGSFTAAEWPPRRAVRCGLVSRGSPDPRPRDRSAGCQYSRGDRLTRVGTPSVLDNASRRAVVFTASPKYAILWRSRPISAVT